MAHPGHSHPRSCWPLACLLLAIGLLVANPVEAGWTVSGTVVDGDGAGIDDVDIDILDDAGVSLDLSRELTDVDGVFDVTMLGAPVSGYHSVRFTPPAGSDFLVRVVEDVLIEANTEMGEVELFLPALLSGRVIDENSDPIEGISLEFYDDTGTQVEFPDSITDVDGLYSVEVEGRVWDIVFRQAEAGDPAYVPERLLSVDVSVDLELDDVTLRVGYSMIGIVEDSGGTAVPGVDIDVRDPITEQTIETPGDVTDVDGAFDILVPAGDWEFVFTAPATEILVAHAEFATIDVPPPDNDLGTIVLADGVEVTGTVVDAGDLGVPGVELEFIDASTDLTVFTGYDNTEVDGAFRAVVEAATYHVRYHPLFATGLAPIEEFDTELLVDTDLGTITLSSGFALTGNVTDGTDTVAGVQITVQDVNTADPVYVFGNATNALGDYAFILIGDTYDPLFTPPVESGLPSITWASLAVFDDTVLDVELITVDPPPSVTDLDCVQDLEDVVVSWTNVAGDYDSIDVMRDGVLLASVAGGDESYLDIATGVGSFDYDIIPIRIGQEATAATCSITTEQVPPPPVTGIACVASAADVSVSWALGADDYSDVEIVRDGVFVATLAGSATSFDDGPLDDGSYTYGVTPIRTGVAGTTTECTVEVDAVPQPISGLSCSVDATTATLTWANDDLDYTGIEIQRDGVVLQTLAGTATSFEDLDLDDATYTYAVTPERSGFAAAATECTVEVGAIPEPVSALLCTVDGMTATLTWTNGNTDYTGIEIQRDGVVLETLEGTATSFEDSGLLDAAYTYAVIPERAGFSGGTTECTIIVDAIPEPVSDLLCTADGTTATLTWTNGEANYTGIEIQRDDVVVGTLAGTATTFEELDLDDATYSYVVIPVRAGFSAAVTECDVTVDAIPEPVSALLCTVDATTATLTWTNGDADYTGVEIQRDGVVLDTLAGTATSYEDLDLDDASYTYAVIPERGGFSPTATECTVEVDAIPEPVSALLCTVDGTTATLAWTNGDADYTGIEIQRDGVVLATLAGTATSYDDLDLDDASYTYAVIPHRGGFSPAATECTVEVDATPEPVADLLCPVDGTTATLTWTNGDADYTGIEIQRDGVVVATLEGTATSFGDLDLDDATYTYGVTPERDGLSAGTVECGVTVDAIPGPVSDLLCTVDGMTATLTWTNGDADYTGIEIQRDGVVVATLAGTATSYEELDLDDADYTYTVIPERAGFSAGVTECDVTVDAIPGPVSDLLCAVDGMTATLTWTNGDADYTGIEIQRDGVVVATLEGTATSYEELDLDDGAYTYAVIPERSGFSAGTVECDVTVEAIPEPVSDLLCTVDGSTATLTWTNGDADYSGVEIQRAGVVVANLEGTATSFEDLDLLDAAYTYAVTPERDGFSAASAECDVTVDAIPEPVSDLLCTVDGTTATLTWTNGDPDYTGIEIQRDGVVLETLEGTATSFEELDLDDGAYTYAVIPERSGFSAGPSECIATTDAFPEPVADLLCTVDGTTATLTWTNGDADYTGVEIQRDGVVVATLAGTATSFEDLDLDDVTYFYEVTPERDGFSAAVTECGVTVDAIPESVSDLLCAADGTTATLTWTNGEANYTGIEIQRDGAVLETLAGTATSYEDLDLDNATYTYAVIPERSGFSAGGTECTVEVDVPPETPAVLDIECVASSADVTVSWSLGADDYSDIEISRDGTLLETLDGSATSFVDGPLDDDSYTYAVTPIRDDLAGTTVECTVEVDTVLDPVSDLLCTVDGATASLTWTNGDADYTFVQIQRDGVLIEVLDGDTTSFDDIDLDDATYAYAVLALRTGSSSDATECTVTVDVFPDPLTDLECTVDESSVTLTWTNGSDDYDSVIVLRDGFLVGSVDGAETSYDDLDLADGS